MNVMELAETLMIAIVYTASVVVLLITVLWLAERLILMGISLSHTYDDWKWARGKRNKIKR